MTSLRLPEVDMSNAAAVLVPVDLETWRKRRGLTYEALGEMLQCPLTVARRYAIGEVRIPDEMIDVVVGVTGGEVDVYALHRRRISWLRSNAPERLRRCRGGDEAEPVVKG